MKGKERPSRGRTIKRRGRQKLVYLPALGSTAFCVVGKGIVFLTILLVCMSLLKLVHIYLDTGDSLLI